MLQTPRKPQRPIFPNGLPTPREARLSHGEIRVLDRLRVGAKQPTIAAELGNSVHTVRTVARNIREKFEAHSVAELLHGLEAGVYTIAAKPVSEGRAFNLASAIGILEREHDRSQKGRGMRTIRMHSDEISALLGLAQSYHAVVARSAQLSENLGSVVGRVEKLVDKIKDERASLAHAVGRELGAADAEGRNTRSAKQIERLGAIFASTPFALYGDAREKILDSFRTGYNVGRRDHEAKRPRA